MLPVVAFLCLAADLSHPDIPYSQPQVASDGKVTGVVFGSRGRVFYATPESAPVAVADAPNLALGNHRGPRLAFTRAAIVVTATIAPPGQEFTPGTLRTWRSTDRGATWSAGPRVSDPGSGGMGFQGIASDGGKTLWAAWIGPHNGHPSLYVSHSPDEGVTWAPQTVLSETVCECCHPSVAIAANGVVHVLFRNNTGGNRDFYLATARDGRRFDIVKLGRESWRLDACPMDGGGLGVFGDSIVTLWRRRGQLYTARPDGGAEEPFGAGYNAAVTLRADGMYAVWSDGDGVVAKLPGKGPVRLAKSGAFPSISPAGSVFAAWEDAGHIRIERLLP